MKISSFSVSVHRLVKGITPEENHCLQTQNDYGTYEVVKNILNFNPK